MLTMLMFSNSMMTYADEDIEEVNIGQEVVAKADGKNGSDTYEELQRDTNTSESESSQDVSGSTNQNTYVKTASEQERENSIDALANARNALIEAAKAKIGEMFGSKGTYYETGMAKVTDTQINDICDALTRFNASLQDMEAPEYMRIDSRWNNSASAAPGEITIDGSVDTLTSQEYKTIEEELGCDGSKSKTAGILLPNGTYPLTEPNFYALYFSLKNNPPFTRQFYGNMDATIKPSDGTSPVNIDKWLKFNGIDRTTVKTDLIKDGLKMAKTWTGMFSQYEGYRSNAMNDFVTTTYIKEYKIQKVERDVLSEISYTSDERRWQVYRYENGEWVEYGDPIETNNPEHEFRASSHEAGTYKITAKQKGSADKTTYVYYATCEYTFDTGSGALIRYQEISIDNGMVGGINEDGTRNTTNMIILKVQKGIEDWYDTGDEKYFKVNDLGEIETSNGITERVG